MKQVIIFLGMLAVICLSQSTCLTAIIHVPADQPTIQAGIDAAVDGDTVLVADGTYTGDGNRDIDFMGKAITLTSENGPKTCIIDCQATTNDPHRGFYFHSFETRSSMLNGFTIRNGVAYSRDASSISWGGAILITDASPLIKQCEITQNRAGRGGGIYIKQNSNAEIIQCSISANYANPGGGMVVNDSDIAIIRCSIHDNIAGGYEGYSGGIDCYNSNLLIENTIIVGNLSYGNHSDCGGMQCGRSNVTLVNSVIANNRTNPGLGGGVVVYDTNLIVINTIIWNNVPDQINNWSGSTIEISHSNIQKGWKGIGNIETDPLFVGSNTSFDYRLSPFSPCIDSGTYERAPLTDLDNNSRSDGHVDMGAYEFHWPSETHAFVGMPSHEFTPGDRVSCSVRIWNTLNDLPDNTKLFVILDVLGNYYFAPSFSSFDYYTRSFPNGLTEIPILPEFTWPSNMGNLAGLFWYAALTNPVKTELWSEIGVFDFEYWE